jgi:hypothetical protein
MVFWMNSIEGRNAPSDTIAFAAIQATVLEASDPDRVAFGLRRSSFLDGRKAWPAGRKDRQKVIDTCG